MLKYRHPFITKQDLLGGRLRFPVGNAGAVVESLLFTAVASGGVTGTATTLQAQTATATGSATIPFITGTASTSQSQTIVANGTASPAEVTGTIASSQAQTVDATGVYSAIGVTGSIATSQAQIVAGAGADSVASVSGVLASSQTQTVALAGNASPAVVSGVGAASQAQTTALSGSFVEAGGVSGAGNTSQGQSVIGNGEVSGGEIQPTDTHDGYWAKQWLTRKPKKKELIEAIKENPLEIVASITEVQQEVTRVYPNIDYNAVKENIKLQQFIATQILESLQRQQDEDDEIEALFLLL